MSIKLKSGSEKRLLKDQKMLVKAGSDPKQKKLSFSKEVNITNVNSNVFSVFSNEDKVTISSESEVGIIILYYMILYYNLFTQICIY